MATTIRLTEASEQYARHLRSQGLAENTVKNSVQPMNRAVTLWGDVLLSNITHAHIDNLFSHYGWKESTRNLYLSQLNQFFRWARLHKYMPKDSGPTDGWKSIRVPKKDRTRIPVEEFNDLLDAATHPRDRAVIALGLYTFLRGSELQALRICDLDLDDDLLEVYRIKTKTGDTLPVSIELHEEMVRWLSWYRQDAGLLKLPDHWYLVPAKNPNHTGYDPVTHRIFVDTDIHASLRPQKMLTNPYTVIQRVMVVLGYDIYWEGEHTLRRSGARALFDALREDGVGKDSALMRCASMLGHADVRVTQKYLGWNEEKVQRNAALSGKAMFPAQRRAAEGGTVSPIRKEA